MLKLTGYIRLNVVLIKLLNKHWVVHLECGNEFVYQKIKNRIKSHFNSKEYQ